MRMDYHTQTSDSKMEAVLHGTIDSRRNYCDSIITE